MMVSLHNLIGQHNGLAFSALPSQTLDTGSHDPYARASITNNPRHFLDFSSPLDLDLDRLLELSMQYHQGHLPFGAMLAGKDVCGLFELHSTRTRLSTLRAVGLLGGRCVVLDSDHIQLSRGETTADTMRMLSSFTDALVLRTSTHERLMEFVNASSVPVINGLTSIGHPCQVVADLLTYQSIKGNVRGQTIAWIGDGNNMLMSWMEAAALLDIHLRVCIPHGYEPPQHAVDTLLNSRLGSFTPCENLDDAVDGVSCVMTDTWASMLDDKKSQRLEAFAHLQVTDDVMRKTDNAIFMHCLPAYRGQEVQASVIDGSHSAVWQQAANRVPAMQAILSWCFGYMT